MCSASILAVLNGQRPPTCLNVLFQRVQIANSHQFEWFCARTVINPILVGHMQRRLRSYLEFCGDSIQIDIGHGGQQAGFIRNGHRLKPSFSERAGDSIFTNGLTRDRFLQEVFKPAQVARSFADGLNPESVLDFLIDSSSGDRH